MKRGKQTEYKNYKITKIASNIFTGKHYSKPDITGCSLSDIKIAIDIREQLIKLCRAN